MMLPPSVISGAAAADGDERVDADVVRDAEALAAGVDELAAQSARRGEGDGVDQDVDLAVLLLERGEKGVDLLRRWRRRTGSRWRREIVDQALGFGFMRSFW
jgi:hypothetical protein